MGWMPTDTGTRYAMGLPTLAESEAAKDREKELEKENIRARSQSEAEKIKWMREQSRPELGGGYKKGGPVVDVGYKHNNNPMYEKYSSSMDSSLLAKGRSR